MRRRVTAFSRALAKVALGAALVAGLAAPIAAQQASGGSVRQAGAVRPIPGQTPAQPVQPAPREAERTLPEARFLSLKETRSIGRAGPSLDHAAMWEYHRQGLPMLVLREWNGFKQVRDPDGNLVWMADRLFSERPSFVVRPASGRTAVLRQRPEADARGVAELEVSVVGTLSGCEDGWCEVRVSDVNGWIADADLWGSPEDARVHGRDRPVTVR